MPCFTPLICFCGPDGSGKSTLAKVLVEKLTSYGFRVKLSWMRGTHTFASILAMLFSRFNVFKGSDNPYYMISIPKSLRRIWQILELLSVLPVLARKFLLPSVLGVTVVAERYLLDFITWVAITTNDSKYPLSFEARFLIALVSKTKVRVYVTADFAALKSRRDDSSLFLQKQLDIYEGLAKSVGAYKLDTTNKTVNESATILLTLLEHNLSFQSPD